LLLIPTIIIAVCFLVVPSCA
jgi:hypothetical protein